jgi:predicted DNA-binding transcriptional regulator AlpA
MPKRNEGGRLRTIDNMMKQRRLPFIKLTSKTVRFPKGEVDACLTRNVCVEADSRKGHEQG